MKKSSGFTIIELLAVMAIIVTLAGIGIPAYLSWQNRARIAKAKTTIAKIEMALEMYKTDYGEYPPEGQDLNNPANPINRVKNYLAPYMKFKGEDMGTADSTYSINGHVLLDPWGRYYTVLVYCPQFHEPPGVYPPDFVHNKKSIYIYSRGPDGSTGDFYPDPKDKNDADNDNIDNFKQ